MSEATTTSVETRQAFNLLSAEIEAAETQLRNMPGSSHKGCYVEVCENVFLQFCEPMPGKPGSLCLVDDNDCVIGCYADLPINKQIEYASELSDLITKAAECEDKLGPDACEAAGMIGEAVRQAIASA